MMVWWGPAARSSWAEMLSSERCALVTVGRAVPSGASAPYRPLAEAVLRAVRARGVPAGEPDLTPWLPALEPVVPLPGLPPTGRRRPDGSPAVRGEAMLRLLRWLGSGRGLLVVLEDLHWADPDTLDVVEYLADNLGGEAVLCVGTLRGAPPSHASELADRLGSRGSASLTDLEALDDAAVEAIVRGDRPGHRERRPGADPEVRGGRAVPGGGTARRARGATLVRRDRARPHRAPRAIAGRCAHCRRAARAQCGLDATGRGPRPPGPHPGPGPLRRVDRGRRV